MYKLLFCPTFQNEFDRTLKPYSKNREHVKNDILALRQNPFAGDAYPGFSPFHIRKIRFALKTYRLSKRNGLRFIYLVIAETESIIPLHIYKKGEYKKEQDVLRRIKQNVKRIIEEKETGQGRDHLE